MKVIHIYTPTCLAALVESGAVIWTLYLPGSFMCCKGEGGWGQGGRLTLQHQVTEGWPANNMAYSGLPHNKNSKRKKRDSHNNALVRSVSYIKWTKKTCGFSTHCNLIHLASHYWSLTFLNTMLLTTLFTGLANTSHDCQGKDYPLLLTPTPLLRVTFTTKYGISQSHKRVQLPANKWSYPHFEE